MKKYNRILFLAALVLFSCKDDKDDMDTMSASGNPVGIVENSHTSGQTVSVDFRGRITNQQGAPIAGATVSAGGSITISNAQGFYQIEDAAVDDNYALVKVEYNGMFDQFRALKPRADQTNYVDIALIQKIVNGFFSTASGGVINVPGGPTVSFPAGELVTSGGQPYSGEVLVASTYLDPSDPSLMSYMPGSLAAIDDEGEAVGMITYGMVGVELSAASNGQKLQLAGGRKATITLPLPETHASHAPQSIPLWYFDQTAGIWQEEGVATRSGNSYVGQVGHFSFWNCDVSVNSVFLEGHLYLQPEGIPLFDTRVKIERQDGGFASTQVDQDGYFSGIVPGNELLTFIVESGDCNQILYSTEIGPFTDDVDMGEVPLELSTYDFGIVEFQGTVVGCDSDPLLGILVIVNLPGSNFGYYTTTNQNGEWDLAIPCLDQGQVFINAFDISELTEAEELILPYNIEQSPLVEAGEIDFCDAEEVIEYLIYSDGENELEFDVVQANIGNCGVLYAFNGGNESTEYLFAEDFFGLSFGTLSDTSWTVCGTVDIDLRGYSADGEYLIVTISSALFNASEIQYINSDSFYLFQGELSSLSNVGGFSIQVEVYESHLSTTPTSTYAPDEAVINMLVTENE
ncbi:hypothetical protein O3Q51_00645 [Cryomorphaceae bacterium 1068]|nr:hypothetical protein [Cryomorphaceae bacterium 1068]